MSIFFYRSKKRVTFELNFSEVCIEYNNVTGSVGCFSGYNKCFVTIQFKFPGEPARQSKIGFFVPNVRIGNAYVRVCIEPEVPWAELF